MNTSRWHFCACCAAATAVVVLATGAEAATPTKPLLAVFDVEARSLGLGGELLKDLRAYLGAQATAAGFRVLPRTGAQSHLYEVCSSHACQRQSARQLGAERALLCELQRAAAGATCTVTLLLMEVRRAAAERVKVEGACSEEGLSSAIKTAVSMLSGKATASKPLPPEPPRPPPGVEPTPDPSATPASTTLKGDSATRSIGPKNAPIVIDVYSDYQCPFCAALHETLLKLLRANPGKIRLQRRDYPLDSACNPSISAPFHVAACEAAFYARCAAAQGKFWEMDALLFKDARALDAARLTALAQQLQLNGRKLKSCLASRKTRNAVIADINEARSRGVNATPTSFVNRQLVSGALGLDAWERKVQEILRARVP
jgi:protein-disulfide isomerase